jgi:hypothetical protein
MILPAPESPVAAVLDAMVATKENNARQATAILAKEFNGDIRFTCGRAASPPMSVALFRPCMGIIEFC